MIVALPSAIPTDHFFFFCLLVVNQVIRICFDDVLKIKLSINLNEFSMKIIQFTDNATVDFAINHL